MSFKILVIIVNSTGKVSWFVIGMIMEPLSMCLLGNVSKGTPRFCFKVMEPVFYQTQSFNFASKG